MIATIVDKNMLRRVRVDAARAAPILSAYLLTTGMLIIVVWLLDRELGADRLQQVLVYFLVASVAAGIEPGTAKSALLRRREGPFVMTLPMYHASAVKAVLCTPAFVALWWVSAGSGAGLPEGVAWAPVLVILGFVATDLRVVLDARASHAAAIWLKQGSLTLGLGVSAAALLAGAGFAMAIGLACLARLGWTLLFATASRSTGPAQSPMRLLDHLRERPWRDFLLTSAIGSLAASIDRIVAFRMLEAEFSNAYVVIYELLTKFWLLPYLLAPLIFVKTAQGTGSARFSRKAHLAIVALGIPFIAVSAALPQLSIPLVPHIAASSLSLAIFALAIVIASFNQLIAGQLQGQGNTRQAAISAAGGLFVAAIAFPILVAYFGAAGLFWAWLAKSLVESMILGGFLAGKRQT